MAEFRTQEGEASVEAYRGVAEWDSVDAHTAFTQRPEFEGSGEAIAPYLDVQPEARHGEAVG